MKTILGLFVGIILLAGAFAGGVLVGHLVPSSNQLPFLSDLIPSSPSATPEEQAATPDGLETLFAPFWEAWNIVHEQYVDQPVDDVELMDRVDVHPRGSWSAGVLPAFEIVNVVTSAGSSDCGTLPRLTAPGSSSRPRSRAGRTR